jgi:hypothetical protein
MQRAVFTAFRRQRYRNPGAVARRLEKIDGQRAIGHHGIGIDHDPLAGEIVGRRQGHQQRLLFGRLALQREQLAAALDHAEIIVGGRSKQCLNPVADDLPRAVGVEKITGELVLLGNPGFYRGIVSVFQPLVIIGYGYAVVGIGYRHLGGGGVGQSGGDRGQGGYRAGCDDGEYAHFGHGVFLGQGANITKESSLLEAGPALFYDRAIAIERTT